jgi:hypothetical protein
MSTALAFLFVVSFLVSIIVALAASILRLRVVSALKQRHHETWETVGSPSFASSSIKNARQLSKFIRDGQYRRLNDESLVQMINWTRVLGPIAQVSFVVALVVLVVSWLY